MRRFNGHWRNFAAATSGRYYLGNRVSDWTSHIYVNESRTCPVRRKSASPPFPTRCLLLLPRPNFAIWQRAPPPSAFSLPSPPLEDPRPQTLPSSPSSPLIGMQIYANMPPPPFLPSSHSNFPMLRPTLRPSQPARKEEAKDDDSLVPPNSLSSPKCPNSQRHGKKETKNRLAKHQEFLLKMRIRIKRGERKNNSKFHSFLDLSRTLCTPSLGLASWWPPSS